MTFCEIIAFFSFFSLSFTYLLAHWRGAKYEYFKVYMFDSIGVIRVGLAKQVL